MPSLSKTCQTWYSWVSDKSYLKEMGKNFMSLPVSIACAVTTKQWMTDDYLKNKK